MPKGRKGRPKGSRNKAKPMRKINSTRKAYSKPVRNQMILRRAGVVETKQRVDADIAALNGHTDESDWQQPLAWKPLGYSTHAGVANLGTNAFTLIPLESFTRNSLGLQEYQMVGQNITSKFLKVKVQFRFPHAEYIRRQSGDDLTQPTQRNLNTMINGPCKLYFICGWVTKNLGRPLQISQVGDGLKADQVTEASLHRFITDQIEPYFDTDEDKLSFRPKATSNIRIEHYSRVKPDLTHAIGTQANPETTWVADPGGVNPDWHIGANGSIPDVYKSWTFKTGRKIPLTLGLPAEENATGKDTQNFYPNDSWLPFCVAYNPDYDQLLEQWVDPASPGTNPYYQKVCQIQFRHNSAHYYTDS